MSLLGVIGQQSAAPAILLQYGVVVGGDDVIRVDDGTTPATVSAGSFSIPVPTDVLYTHVKLFVTGGGGKGGDGQSSSSWGQTGSGGGGSAETGVLDVAITPAMRGNNITGQLATPGAASTVDALGNITSISIAPGNDGGIGAPIEGVSNPVYQGGAGGLGGGSDSVDNGWTKKQGVAGGKGFSGTMDQVTSPFSSTQEFAEPGVDGTFDETGARPSGGGGGGGEIYFLTSRVANNGADGGADPSASDAVAFSAAPYFLAGMYAGAGAKGQNGTSSSGDPINPIPSVNPDTEYYGGGGGGGGGNRSAAKVTVGGIGGPGMITAVFYGGTPTMLQSVTDLSFYDQTITSLFDWRDSVITGAIPAPDTVPQEIVDAALAGSDSTPLYVGSTTVWRYVKATDVWADVTANYAPTAGFSGLTKFYTFGA